MNLYCVFYSILFYSNSTMVLCSRFMYENILSLRRMRKIKCQHWKSYYIAKVFAFIMVSIRSVNIFIFTEPNNNTNYDFDDNLIHSNWSTMFVYFIVYFWPQTVTVNEPSVYYWFLFLTHSVVYYSNFLNVLIKLFTNE